MLGTCCSEPLGGGRRWRLPQWPREGPRCPPGDCACAVCSLSFPLPRRLERRTPWFGAAKPCIVANPTSLLPMFHRPDSSGRLVSYFLRMDLTSALHLRGSLILQISAGQVLKMLASPASSSREPLKGPALFTFFLNGFALYSSSNSVLCCLNIAPYCCLRPLREPCVYYLTRCLSVPVVCLFTLILDLSLP